MQTHVSKTVGLVFALIFMASLPTALSAQSNSAKALSSDSPSRFDIFAGYSYLAPKGTVQIPLANGSTAPYSYDAVNVGAIASGAYYFNRFVGVQLELAEHEWGGSSGTGSNIGTRGNDDGFATFSGGMIFRFPSDNITPFVHALIGGSYIDGPYHNGPQWGPDLTVGGGMDYETPWFDHHLAIRLFQADFEYMHADFGPQVNPPGGRANIDAARLSAGVVIHVGSLAPPPPVTLACSASPESVFPGEPVTITATAGALNPKEHVIYTWSGQSVTGTDTTAKMDTSSLAPGQYTASATIKEGKPGKEGLKPWQTATCSANVTVKEFEPPTISCSANPTTIKPGETSTITCTGVSPQNRPLTYSYSATAGTITGSGTTAEYSSAGAPTGSVGITGNVSDDKGHSASAQTGVTIEAPPPPPQPHAQTLCSISFATDKARPTRVDNEAKACLDQVALDLKQQADAKAVLVGESDAKEKATTDKQEKYAVRHKRAKVEHFAEQRAINAKDYLVTEQGIDASRVSVNTDANDGQQVQNYLVPSGANFGADVSGTTPVDETQLKPEERKPLPERHHAGRPASQ